MTTSLEYRGYSVFDWNVVTNDSILYMAPDETNAYDYIRETFAETFETCVKSSADGSPIIILMHETVSETVDLLPWVIEYIIDRGYSFGRLDDIGYSWMFANQDED